MMMKMRTRKDEQMRMEKIKRQIKTKERQQGRQLMTMMQMEIKAQQDASQ